MSLCPSCATENPEERTSCLHCGAALPTEEKKPTLFGTMGGRRYGLTSPESEEKESEAELPGKEAPETEAPETEAPVTEEPVTEAPVTEEPAAEEPAAAGSGLLGSMGGKRYEGPSSSDETAGEAGTGTSGKHAAPPPDPKGSGVAGSMGGVRYGIKPKEEPEASLKEEGVAGSMGEKRYGIKPPDPPPVTEPPSRKRPDKGLIIAAAVTITALAAVLLLVFGNAISGGAETYGMGLGGFVNYYKPIEEEEILEEDGVKYVGDEIVIVSALGTPYEDMERFFDERNMKIVGYVELIDTYQVQLDQSYTLLELHTMAKELEAEALVDSATVNAVHENSGFAFPSDPWAGDSNWSEPTFNTGNWGVMAIHAPESWARWEPTEVRAGVVDSVFDESHPDLNFAMTKDNEAFYYVRDESSRAHGTHVSGIIGAIHNNGMGVAGVAENCRIYGYSTLRYEGTIEEVSAFAELAAQDVRVINYSMGLIREIQKPAMERNGMERDIYYHYAAAFSQTAMKHLIQKGYDFVLVCAAGNDPVDARWASEYAYITDPMIRSRIIVVGAAGIDRDGSYYGANWSGRGERVDVFGPGVGIYSTYPDRGCTYMDGTSMATPHVTGVCASVWALNPSLSGADVKRIVVETANIPVSGGDANMVNMEAAMEAAAR